MEKSNGIKSKSVGRGQSIMTATGQETPGQVKVPNTFGGKMGGGTENLKHSLSGASTVDAEGLGTS